MRVPGAGAMVIVAETMGGRTSIAERKCNCRRDDARSVKHGKNKCGNQRYKCATCGATFVDESGPLGSMRLDMKTATMALAFSHCFNGGDNCRCAGSTGRFCASISRTRWMFALICIKAFTT